MQSRVWTVLPVWQAFSQTCHPTDRVPLSPSQVFQQHVTLLHQIKQPVPMMLQSFLLEDPASLIRFKANNNKSTLVNEVSPSHGVPSPSGLGLASVCEMYE